MKIPKQINIKTTLLSILIAILATSAILYVFAATPTTTFTIGPGVFPGAPTYTIWREGSNYFAKDENGDLKYSGNNATVIFQSCGTSNEHLFVAAGTYQLVSLPLIDDVAITGENWATTILQFSGDGITIRHRNLLRDLSIQKTGSQTGEGVTVTGQQNNIENVWISSFETGLLFNASVTAAAVENQAEVRVSTTKYGVVFDGNATSSPNANDIYIKAYNTPPAAAGSIGVYFKTICQSNIVMGMIESYEKVIYGLPWRCYCVLGAEGDSTFAEIVNASGTGNTIIEMYSLSHNFTVDADSQNIILSGYFGAIFTANRPLLIGGNTGVYSVYYDDSNTRLTVRRVGVDDYLYLHNDGTLDTNHNEIKGVFETGGTPPSSPVTGQWWYDTSAYTLKIYNGTDWAVVQGATGPAGPPGGLEGAQPYSYLIFENATSKYLQDGSDGSIITNNADASVLVQYVVDNYETWWLHFTDGTFECNTQVDFGTETYFMISGSGWSTILELNANLGTGVDFWEFDYTALSHGRFIVRDLYFDMQGDTYTSRDCISIVGGERWKLENIKILMPYRDGLNIDETGGTGYTRYFTVESFQVYYAGRYGVYCDGRDGNFFDIQIEYSWDTCFVFAAGGVGCSLFRLHSTGAHNTGEYYGSGIGGGLGRYAGLEMRGTAAGGNTVHGAYLDRCNRTGAYITGSNNALIGGRVYECNYQAASSAYADVYIDGDYNRVVGMELNGQASNPTNYGVHLDTGSNNCAVTSNIGRDHAISHFQDDGTSNEMAHNA